MATEAGSYHRVWIYTVILSPSGMPILVAAVTMEAAAADMTAALGVRVATTTAATADAPGMKTGKMMADAPGIDLL